MTILKAVHFNIKESTFLSALSVPFKAIELNKVIKEDALAWLEVIN